MTWLASSESLIHSWSFRVIWRSRSWQIAIKWIVWIVCFWRRDDWFEAALDAVRIDHLDAPEADGLARAGPRITEAWHAQRIIGKVAPATEAGAGAEGISHFRLPNCWELSNSPIIPAANGASTVLPAIHRGPEHSPTQAGADISQQLLRNPLLVNSHSKLGGKKAPQVRWLICVDFPSLRRSGD